MRNSRLENEVATHLPCELESRDLSPRLVSGSSWTYKLRPMWKDGSWLINVPRRYGFRPRMTSNLSLSPAGQAWVYRVSKVKQNGTLTSTVHNIISRAICLSLQRPFILNSCSVRISTTQTSERSSRLKMIPRLTYLLTRRPKSNVQD